MYRSIVPLLLSLLLGLSVLAGCGQKGALYHADDNAEEQDARR